MNEKMIYAILMWASAALAVIAGAATIFLLVLTVTDGLHLIIPTFLLGVVTVGCGGAAVFYGQRVEGHEKVFSNPVEREVLSFKQRRDLRIKRGEVVMQRSLIEIENERDNIVHRQIEAANDPNKPPHVTRFGIEEPTAQVAAPKRCICRDWENTTLAQTTGGHHRADCPRYRIP